MVNRTQTGCHETIGRAGFWCGGGRYGRSRAGLFPNTRRTNLTGSIRWEIASASVSFAFTFALGFRRHLQHLVAPANRVNLNRTAILAAVLEALGIGPPWRAGFIAMHSRQAPLRIDLFCRDLGRDPGLSQGLPYCVDKLDEMGR
jgi:hypothetical protein